MYEKRGGGRKSITDATLVMKMAVNGVSPTVAVLETTLSENTVADFYQIVRRVQAWDAGRSLGSPLVV